MRRTSIAVWQGIEGETSRFKATWRWRLAEDAAGQFASNQEYRPETLGLQGSRASATCGLKNRWADYRTDQLVSGLQQPRFGAAPVR